MQDVSGGKLAKNQMSCIKERRVVQITFYHPPEACRSIEILWWSVVETGNGPAKRLWHSTPQLSRIDAKFIVVGVVWSHCHKPPKKHM